MKVSDVAAEGKKLGQVILEFTAKNLTGLAGLIPFHEFVGRLGVEELVNERLELNRIGDVYSNGRMVVALLYGLVLGLTRLRDVSLLRLDEVLLKALGWGSFPVQSTFSRFLRKFSAKAVESLGQLNLQLLERVRGGWKSLREIHLDLDSHVRTVYGETLEDAERGYNPNKRGRRSYHPLAAFVGETRDFLCGMFRPGNTTTKGMVAFVNRCLSALDPRRFVRIHVRADSGFCFQEFLVALEEQPKASDGTPTVLYTIALRMYPQHQRRFAGLEFQPVPPKPITNRDGCGVEKPSARDEEEQGAECADYKSKDWPDGKERRIVVIRQPVPDKSSGRRVAGKQLKLFDLQGYAYRAFVTLSTAPAAEVWREYNGRATCENHIKEGIDFGLDVNASRSYQANAAHFLLVMMGYNLLNWYKEIGLDHPEVKPMSKWLRQRLLWIPATLTRSARQLRLKLPEEWPWRDLLDRVVARILAWQPLVT